MITTLSLRPASCLHLSRLSMAMSHSNRFTDKQTNYTPLSLARPAPPLYFNHEPHRVPLLRTQNLPPPYLDPQFEVPSRFLQTPVTTPTSSSPPSSPSSDGHGDGAAPEKMPSGGGGGSRVRGFIGVGAGWHHGGRQRVRW